MSKVLIALGGNALGNSPTEQKNAVHFAASTVVKLVKEGHEVTICHGNGPQVGMINNAFDAGQKCEITKEVMPFAECGAMSEGYIGYHLQNAIDEELFKNNIDKDVVTIITQTLVDKEDKAFDNPTKPIGPFMSKKEAEKLAKENGFDIVEDSGRGWRRVVPSPKPIDIQEKRVIDTIFSKGAIVIAGGGGGIPVYRDKSRLVGVDAVIDKDLTSAKLADLLRVDYFVILTAIKRVMLNFNQPDQKELVEVGVDELKRHIKDGQFAPGSMLPKIEAIISFVESTGNPAYIGKLEDANDIISGKQGTKITL